MPFTSFSGQSDSDIQGYLIRMGEMEETNKRTYLSAVEGLSRAYGDEKAIKKYMSTINSVLGERKSSRSYQEDAQREIQFRKRLQLASDPKFRAIAEAANRLMQKELAVFSECLDHVKRNGFTNLPHKLSKGELVVLKDAFEGGMPHIERHLKEEYALRVWSTVNTIGEKAGTILELELHPNAKDGFDGWVRGTLGKFRIETIGASGSVQRYHLRTLIHPV